VIAVTLTPSRAKPARDGGPDRVTSTPVIARDRKEKTMPGRGKRLLILEMTYRAVSGAARIQPDPSTFPLAVPLGGIEGRLPQLRV